MAGSTMQVNIVAADHPVWHGTAKSVTIPAWILKAVASPSR